MGTTTIAPKSAGRASAGGEPKRHRLSAMRRREAMWCYAFMAPAVLGLLLFSIGPMIASFVLSFTEYDMMSPPEWIGGKNYTKMIADPLFRKSLMVTLQYAVFVVPLTMLLGLIVAILLNASIRRWASSGPPTTSPP